MTDSEQYALIYSLSPARMLATLYRAVRSKGNAFEIGGQR